MRVLVLQAGPRDQRAGIPEGRDDRLVGVALVARVGDDPPAGKARSFFCEKAVSVYRVGDGRIDAAIFEPSRVLGPDLEIVAAMVSLYV